MFVIQNAVAQFCEHNELTYTAICSESDLAAYSFQKRSRLAVEDLAVALRPLVVENRLHTKIINTRTATILLISRAAVSEETVKTILGRTEKSSFHNRLDIAFEGQVMPPPDAAPIGKTRRMPKKINEAQVAQQQPGLEGIAAPIQPKELQQSLFTALRHTTMGRDTLFNTLKKAGIKCKWQQSGETVSDPNGGMVFPYLQFYKDSEGGTTNLLVIDVQSIGETKGMEDAIKSLVGLANNQGIGSVDAALARADALKSTLRDAGKFSPGAKPEQAAVVPAR